MSNHVMISIGTRPEAIKLMPVIWELLKTPDIDTRICVTGQHGPMLAPLLREFSIKPSTPNELRGSGARLQCLFASAERAFDSGPRPSVVIVQGDTASTLAVALSAYYRGLVVAHVEAGLRTGVNTPFPEEVNRRLIAQLTTYHYAPTLQAATNLVSEAIPRKQILVTGNTGIDAMRIALGGEINTYVSSRAPRHVLFFAHRRESLSRMLPLLMNLVEYARCRPNLTFTIIRHHHPAVEKAIAAALPNRLDNIRVMEQVGYKAFLRVVLKSDIVVTDSGGLQEEAPTLGKPVLVLCNATSRMEAVDNGQSELVGTSPGRVLRALERISNLQKYSERARPSFLYGDGYAASRIAVHVRNAIIDGK